MGKLKEKNTSKILFCPKKDFTSNDIKVAF